MEKIIFVKLSLIKKTPTIVDITWVWWRNVFLFITSNKPIFYSEIDIVASNSTKKISDFRSNGPSPVPRPGLGGGLAAQRPAPMPPRPTGNMQNASLANRPLPGPPGGLPAPILPT